MIYSKRKYNNLQQGVAEQDDISKFLKKDLKFPLTISIGNDHSKSGTTTERIAFTKTFAQS